MRKMTNKRMAAYCAVVCTFAASVSVAQGAGKCYPSGGRFTVNAGIVLDGMTGLSWHQAIAPETMTSLAAQAYCTSLGSRLPSMTELYTLVDIARVPRIDHTFFPNTPAANFWTSIKVREQPRTYYVNFSTGEAQQIDGNNSFHVRCVR